MNKALHITFNYSITTYLLGTQLKEPSRQLLSTALFAIIKTTVIIIIMRITSLHSLHSPFVWLKQPLYRSIHQQILHEVISASFYISQSTLLFIVRASEQCILKWICAHDRKEFLLLWTSNGITCSSSIQEFKMLVYLSYEYDLILLPLVHPFIPISTTILCLLVASESMQGILLKY